MFLILLHTPSFFLEIRVSIKISSHPPGVEIVKNETQLIKQKRGVNETRIIRQKREVSCPTSGSWIKNIYDECYQTNQLKNYPGAITHCLNLDSKAHLPILIQGTRFIRLYSHIKENTYLNCD